MILDKFKLCGKVAIVTGASTGLGQAICYSYAEAGAKVVGVDYIEMPETQAKIEAMGAEFMGVVANLMSIKPIREIVDATIAKFGKVDLLVNNAGIIRREDAIDFSEENWDDVININQKTVFFFSQAVAKKYIEQGTGGKIINIASMLSFQGGVRVPSYTEIGRAHV